MHLFELHVNIAIRYDIMVCTVFEFYKGMIKEISMIKSSCAATTNNADQLLRELKKHAYPVK